MTQIGRVKALVGTPVIVKLNDGSTVGGKLSSAGWNKFLGQLQINIDGMILKKEQFIWQNVIEFPEFNNPKAARLDFFQRLQALK